MPPRRATRRTRPPPEDEDDDHLPESVPPSPGVTAVDDAEALPALSAYVAPTPRGGGVPAAPPGPPPPRPRDRAAAAGGQAEDPDDGVFRILISTDNHLGVHEKDDVRKDDSFASFDEVLGLATTHGADAVLLGGDLFHENKPSREAVVRAMTSLSSACLVGGEGDHGQHGAPAPSSSSHPGVRFDIISPNPGADFAAGAPNFTAPGHRVRLPVFSIHGNHDDPVGPGSLSAVDVLSSAGLVNYFGKRALEGSAGSTVVMSPILLQKGSTKIALYGLGNVRDERMARVLATPGAVAWEKPAGHEQYFSVFVLHQNRVPHGRSGARNTVQPRHLPEWLDFVVWGHEHESQPDPVRDPVQGFMILQPGSTVATALSPGEAEPKHAILLEVKGTNWRTTALPLRSVRPFAFAQVSLKDLMPSGTRPDDSAAITAALEAKVDAMIEAAARPGVGAGGRSARPPPDALGGPSTILAPPAPPLVRLRVDYTGYTTLSSARLAGQFVGKVANPADLFLWVRANAANDRGGAGGTGPAGARAAAAAALAAAGGTGSSSRSGAELDGRALAAVVAGAVGGALEVVGPTALGAALHAFVDKDERSSLADAVAAEVAATLAAAGPGLKRVADGAAAKAAEAARAAQAEAVGGGGGGQAAARHAAATTAAARSQFNPAAAAAAASALPTDEDIDLVLREASASRHRAANAAAAAAAEGGPAGGAPSALAAAEPATTTRPPPPPPFFTARPAPSTAATAMVPDSPTNPTLNTQASGRRPAAAAGRGRGRARAAARPAAARPTLSASRGGTPGGSAGAATRPRRQAADRGEARRVAAARASADPEVFGGEEEEEEDELSASDSDAAGAEEGGNGNGGGSSEEVDLSEEEDQADGGPGRRRARLAGDSAGRGRPAKRGRGAGGGATAAATARARAGRVGAGPPDTQVLSSDEEEEGEPGGPGGVRGRGGGGGAVPPTAPAGRVAGGLTQLTSAGWGGGG